MHSIFTVCRTGAVISNIAKKTSERIRGSGSRCTLEDSSSSPLSRLHCILFLRRRRHQGALRFCTPDIDFFKHPHRWLPITRNNCGWKLKLPYTSSFVYYINVKNSLEGFMFCRLWAMCSGGIHSPTSGKSHVLPVTDYMRCIIYISHEAYMKSCKLHDLLPEVCDASPISYSNLTYMQFHTRVRFLGRTHPSLTHRFVSSEHYLYAFQTLLC